MSDDQFNTLLERATILESPYHDLAVVGSTTPRLLNVLTGIEITAAAVLALMPQRQVADERLRKQALRRPMNGLPLRVFVQHTLAGPVHQLHRLERPAGATIWKDTGDDGLRTRPSRLTHDLPTQVSNCS